MLQEWLGQYGGEVISMIVTAILGFVGIAIKASVTDWLNDKKKRAIAKTCVLSVEQMYKDLHGEDKLNKCLAIFEDMLSEKGISLSADTMRLLIEEQVAKMNLGHLFDEVDE